MLRPWPLMVTLWCTLSPVWALDQTTAGCERATAYLNSTKLVRAGGKTFITYLDVGFGVRVMARNHATGRWSQPTLVGQGVDNHGGGALLVTSDGFLHLTYAAHGTPMLYSRSLAPLDETRWTAPVPLGRRTTYPCFAQTPEGALHLVYRGHDNPQFPDWNPWLLTYHRLPRVGNWEPSRVLADLPHQPEGKDFRSNYHARLLVDRQGVMHLAWANILVSPSRIYYLRSADSGRTWSNHPTAPALALPINNIGPAPLATHQQDNATIVMAPDPAGTPHLLLQGERGEGSVQHFMAERQGWKELPGFRTPGRSLWLHGATFDAAGRLHITYFAEDLWRWLSNTAVIHEAVWEARRGWRQRVVADFTRYGRGCYMPALTEAAAPLECLFYSGRDLDVATNERGVHAHVGTAVYYANLTENWLQRLTPSVGPKVVLADRWEGLTR